MWDACVGLVRFFPCVPSGPAGPVVSVRLGARRHWPKAFDGLVDLKTVVTERPFPRRLQLTHVVF